METEARYLYLMEIVELPITRSTRVDKGKDSCTHLLRLHETVPERQPLKMLTRTHTHCNDVEFARMEIAEKVLHKIKPRTLSF